MVRGSGFVAALDRHRHLVLVDMLAAQELGPRSVGLKPRSVGRTDCISEVPAFCSAVEGPVRAIVL
jgi:hypothetical protein